MKENPDALINSIRACKYDSGLTWSELAAKGGLKDTGHTIDRWGTYGHKLNLNQLDQIAITFNKTPDFFFEKLPTQTTQKVANCILNCLVCHAEGKKYQGVTLCQVHILNYQSNCKIPQFFAQKIRNRLKERDMTQIDACALLGVKQGILASYTGKARTAVPLEKLTLIAVVLDVPLNYFFTEGLAKKSSTTHLDQVSQMQDMTQPLAPIVAENTNVEPEVGQCYTSYTFDEGVFDMGQPDWSFDTFSLNVGSSAPPDADSKTEAAAEDAMLLDMELSFNTGPSDGWAALPKLFPDDDETLI